MSPCNEQVYQAVPFDGATSDAEEALIAAGGDAEEEEDQQGRLEGRDLPRLKLGPLLFGFFFMVAAAYLGANCLVIYFEMKSNTNVIAFSRLWGLFTVLASVVLIWEFIRNLVAITCFEELRDDRIYQTRGHAVYAYTNMAFCFIWHEAKTASATDGDSKRSSTRRSTAEQTTV
jgi:hypothetical protein